MSKNKEIRKKHFDLVELFKQLISMEKVIARNQNLGKFDHFKSFSEDVYHLPFCLIKPKAKIRTVSRNNL